MYEDFNILNNKSVRTRRIKNLKFWGENWIKLLRRIYNSCHFQSKRFKDEHVVSRGINKSTLTKSRAYTGVRSQWKNARYGLEDPTRRKRSKTAMAVNQCHPARTLESTNASRSRYPTDLITNLTRWEYGRFRVAD